jgi:hypothetical protein
MQIIYKVKEGKVGEAKKIARKRIDEVLPEPSEEVSVRQVFPGLTTGQRARLFTIDLPSQLPDDNVTELIELLRKEDGIEYAERPATKRPM